MKRCKILNQFVLNMIMMASLGVHVHEACIGLLLENRANIHEKVNDGMRALVYASGGG